ncbi:hypothetical protein [Nonomuraea bangladeshensis]|uniref:hypothetical protein n=1 Tax=Nonomuraea bangladeshensis TaxID=404385 RepID=UPI003C303D7B
MAETTEKTIAVELREAAARVREHLVPAVKAWVLPQSALVVLCGDHEAAEEMCRNCLHFSARDRVLARLVASLLNAREPLASWLEQNARWAADSILVEDGGGDAPFHDSDFCDGEIGKNCQCFDHPLAVARALNGTAS